MVSRLAPYVARAQELLDEALGATAVDLDGDRARVRSEETNLGSLIADAMLAKAQGLGADVALMNGGGIRASIPAGNVTMGQILEVLPFGNEITVVTTTGRDLLLALENGVSQVETGGGRFPQVAGMRFSFDPSAPAGSRVREVELRDPQTDSYRTLGAAEVVVVATNDFLASGGDGYTSFAAGGLYDTGWLVADAAAEHVRRISPVDVSVGGRIRRVASP
jgi:5'-nucleotidase